MGKFLKVTGIILAVPVTLALGTFLFVPGLPGKLYVQNKFEHLDSSVQAYPHSEIQTPDDFKEVTQEGITIRIPQSANQLDADSDVKKRIYSNDDVAVVFLEYAENDTFDMFESGETDPENYRKLMECFRTDCPETNYDFFRFIRNFTPDDIIITKHGATAAALSYAVMKETLLGSEGTCYEISTDKAKGFVIHEGSKEDKATYLVELYSKKNPNQSYSVMIKAKSGDVVMWQIVNSAEIAE